MADGFIHPVWKDAEWQNQIEGGDRSPGSYVNKAEAREAGRSRALAVGTGHVIHNQDGTISDRNSYGNDPAPRPGRMRSSSVQTIQGVYYVASGAWAVVHRPSFEAVSGKKTDYW